MSGATERTRAGLNPEQDPQLAANGSVEIFLLRPNDGPTRITATFPRPAPQAKPLPQVNKLYFGDAEV